MVCVCVFVSFVVVCARAAFTAVPGYHERTSVSVAQPAQAAEAVTNDYTYHPRAQEAGEKGEGRAGGGGVEKRQRESEGRVEDENMCTSECRCA